MLLSKELRALQAASFALTIAAPDFSSQRTFGPECGDSGISMPTLYSDELQGIRNATRSFIFNAVVCIAAIEIEKNTLLRRETLSILHSKLDSYAKCAMDVEALANGRISADQQGRILQIILLASREVTTILDKLDIQLENTVADRELELVLRQKENIWIRETANPFSKAARDRLQQELHNILKAWYHNQVAAAPLSSGLQFTTVTQATTPSNGPDANHALDLAITGNMPSWGVVDCDGSRIYSRTGAFKIDKDGTITNGERQKLIGFSTDITNNDLPSAAEASFTGLASTRRLTGVEVDPRGKITARFSDGTFQELGTVRLQNFTYSSTIRVEPLPTPPLLFSTAHGNTTTAVDAAALDDPKSMVRFRARRSRL